MQRNRVSNGTPHCESQSCHGSAPSPVAAFNFEPIALGVIVLATFIAYSPAIRGDVLWDDDAHITVPELRSLHGLYRIWFEPGATQQYYPLLHTAFWLEHKLWGDWLPGYHLINVAWHTVSVLLLYAILKKLTIPGALLAAAIFALHPVMVESVAWISEQKNTLSATFYLAAMLAYFNFAESRARSTYLLSLALFALALLAKTATVVLPPSLLILMWWRHGPLFWRRDIVPLLPFFALGIAASIVTYWVEHSFVGANGDEFAISYMARILVAGRALWFYLGKLVWPANLCTIYPRWQIDPTAWRQWIFVFAALVVTVALYLARKWSRAPLAGWLYFCVALFPVLGFFDTYYFVYSFVADHFQYLASLGPITLVAGCVAHLVNRPTSRARLVGRALCALLVVAMAIPTMSRSRTYADRLIFYQAMLDGNSASWGAHNHLGVALLFTGKGQAGIDHFYEALRLRPSYPSAELNLATSLCDAGHFDEGFLHFQNALQLQPTSFKALNNFGCALMDVGRTEEAVIKLRAALSHQPEEPGALENMGIALAKLGRFSQAIDYFEHALRYRSDNASLYTEIGDEFVQTAQIPQAIENYRRAIRLKSGSPELHFKLAQALARRDRSDEAIATCEKAIALARSSGAEDTAEKIEEWLTHYRIEMRRAAAVSGASEQNAIQSQ